MEKLSLTLDNLIDTQRKSIQQIERMNTKFSELSNSIKNYNESIVTEKKLDELLKKLSSLDQIEKKVTELENKVKDVKAINLQLQQIRVQCLRPPLHNPSFANYECVQL